MVIHKVVRGLLIFPVGALVGIGGTVWWMQVAIQQANEFAAMQTIAAEADEMVKQYRSAKPDVALYALERYITLLESYRGKNLRVLDAIVISTDLALAYTRLGNLAGKLGEPAKASHAYSQALIVYQQAGQKVQSIDELKQLVQRLDENKKP
jgi:tetratricopeptide (TPR) repeat protein